MKYKSAICFLLATLLIAAEGNAQRFRSGRGALTRRQSSKISKPPGIGGKKMPMVSTKPSLKKSTVQAPPGKSKKAADAIRNKGRSGRNRRLTELANDPKLGRAERGWLKQEINSRARGQRKNIRVPVDRELAHKRGYEAAKGFSHSESVLQAPQLHKIQHKHDNMGKKQKTPSASGKSSK